MMLLRKVSLFLSAALFAGAVFANPPTFQPNVGAITPNLIPAPPQIAASSFIVMDAFSGEVIVEQNADQRLDPASLTKMMTSYVADYELRQGNIRLDDEVLISTNAWAQNFPGSSVMFLQSGKTVSVENLLKGVTISSGNDATVALAEHIAGSELAFVDIMNQHAKLLGMTNTHFANPHGLTFENHYTSARDMAILAQAKILHFPEEYKIYSEKEFTYNGIRQPNRNRLLWRDPSVDGLKTGHTEKAGYCLVSSAIRDGMRLIVVVMGTRSDEARFQETQKLLAYGFRYYKTIKPYNKGQHIATVDIWGGKKKQVNAIIADDVYVTIARNQEENVKAELALNKYIQAGVSKGQVLGEITLTVDDKVLLKQAVVAAEDVEKGGFFTVLFSKIKLFFSKLFGG